MEANLIPCLPNSHLFIAKLVQSLNFDRLKVLVLSCHRMGALKVFALLVAFLCALGD